MPPELTLGLVLGMTSKLPNVTLDGASVGGAR